MTNNAQILLKKENLRLLDKVDRLEAELKYWREKYGAVEPKAGNGR